MKKLLMLTAAITFSSTNIWAQCSMLSAQVFAPIESIEEVSDSLCRVKLSWSGNWILNPAYPCPLEVGEISRGVIMSCEGLKIGDSVSGVLYKGLSTTNSEIRIY